MNGVKDNYAGTDKVDLSILIPVFNVESYLSGLLDALFPDLTALTEVIFYDDCSPDNSLSVIRKYQQSYPHVNIRILCGKKNLGITQVRQCLLQASHAEYVWFIDSDDLIEPQAVRQIRNILSEYHPDVVLFDYDVFLMVAVKLNTMNIYQLLPQILCCIRITVSYTALQLWMVNIISGIKFSGVLW